MAYRCDSVYPVGVLPVSEPVVCKGLWRRPLRCHGPASECRGYNYDEGKWQDHARTLSSPFQPGSQTVGTTFHMLVSR